MLQWGTSRSRVASVVIGLAVGLAVCIAPTQAGVTLTVSQMVQRWRGKRAGPSLAFVGTIGVLSSGRLTHNRGEQGYQVVAPACPRRPSGAFAKDAWGQGALGGWRETSRRATQHTDQALAGQTRKRRTRLTRPTREPIRCLFSDIDGTLVHYCEEDGNFQEEAQNDDKLLALPPSSTGRRGYVSKDIFKLVEGLRASGVRFVLITGARSSTSMSRLKYLPMADAYVCENGGRVFLPRSGSGAGAGEVAGGHTGHDEGELEEDVEWLQHLADALGPVEQRKLSPEERQGILWDMYRKLVADGWTVDTKEYYTMLRIQVGDRVDELAEYLKQNLPESLATAGNVGKVDVFPANSGKKNSAIYLAQQRFQVPLEQCASLGDDDNDLDIATAMGKGAFITGFTSHSVEEAVKEHPERFTVAKQQGPQAPVELLRMIVKES